ncbi:hypothetical protein PG299_02580 [Riemerella anatipestifer]|nr:hypothetical protein [Riemerella anatipestifer]
MNTLYKTYRFPDELVSNEVKKSYSFAKKYASAIWNEHEINHRTRCTDIKKLRSYALGNQCIQRIENNITNNGKLIKKEFLRYDKEDRVKFLPRLLRAYYNSVDMSEFSPVIRAIDENAVEIKNKRKEEKLKLYHAKDFLKQLDEVAPGAASLPMDSFPESKEEIDLQEETAKPLRIERGETKALEFISLLNDFPLIQKQLLRDAVETNIMIVKVESSPAEGVKIERIEPEDFITREKTDPFYSQSPYFGVVKTITVSTLKNIAAESGKPISDKDLRAMLNLRENEPINATQKVKVLYYAFKTFFQEVYKKKANRKTKAISLIDRTKDIGTDNEYNPKGKSDISEKIVDNYDVWFEGVMVLNSDRTIIRHRLINNMPEYRGKILPPYIVCSPRDISIIEECIPKIDAIQELRLRILHHRNNLKGDITEIDPDAIANITLGTKLLTPQEVLSYYFTMGLAFRKTKDEDGDFVQNNRPLTQIPESIPRALIELTNQYISEIQDLQQAFGAAQYDLAKPDPKTIYPGEAYRLSDNTAMRDYTDMLFSFSIKVLQNVSSRINDAIRWRSFRTLLENGIGTDDANAIQQYRKDRQNHIFQVFLDYIPSQQERADFLADLTAHVQSGALDALDKMELSLIRNPYQARASLRLRLEAKRKQMQDWELKKLSENQNQNILASNAAYENKSKLSMQEHQQKMELEEKKFQQQVFILGKEGEIKIIESNNTKDAKFQIEEYRNKFNADLTAFKKEQDAKLRKEIQEISAKNQAQMIKLRKGEIQDIDIDGNVKTNEINLSEL